METKNAAHTVLVAVFIVALVSATSAKGEEIAVPAGLHAVRVRCEYAVASSYGQRSVERLEFCGLSWGCDENCGSFQYIHRTNGESSCIYSAVICNPANNDSGSMGYIDPGKSNDFYFMKTQKSWLESASIKLPHFTPLNQNQRWPFGNTAEAVYIFRGCCTTLNGSCDNIEPSAHEADGQEVASPVECGRLCYANPNCLSYRMKWTNTTVEADQSETCFLSDVSCSFMANWPAPELDKAPIHFSPITYIVADRIQANETIPADATIIVENDAKLRVRSA